MAAPAALDLLRPGVVVADDASVRVAERDDDRAGQRGDVDQPLGALGDRVREAVGEHEPALGVGVDDLDRDAVRGRDDIAGAHRATGRHVLRRADHGDDPHRQLAASRSPASRRARPRRRTCRTSSRTSCSAGLIEMPPVSNVTALPTRPSDRTRSVRPVVAHRDERRLLVRALRDRRERAHPARDQPLAALRPTPSRRPARRARCAAAATCRGAISFGGAFCRSRVQLTACATIVASATTSERSSMRREDQRVDVGRLVRAAQP